MLRLLSGGGVFLSGGPMRIRMFFWALRCVRVEEGYWSEGELGEKEVLVERLRECFGKEGLEVVFV
jgi:hypothetical protein